MDSQTLPRSEHEKIVRRCYQRALTALRQKHDQEFHQMLADEYNAAGVSISKRKSRIAAKAEKSSHGQ